MSPTWGTKAPSISQLLLVDGPAVLGSEELHEIGSRWGLGLLRKAIATRTDLEAGRARLGPPAGRGLRIEAQGFNRLLGDPEMVEGVRRFNQRDHPDRVR